MRMNGLQRIVKFGPYSDDKAPSTLGSCPNTLETDSGPTQVHTKYQICVLHYLRLFTDHYDCAENEKEHCSGWKVCSLK